MIANGKHPAKLFDITFGRTNSGAQLVSFVWDVCDCNERVSYAFALTDSAGRPNRFAILVTRRWAIGWDGTDLDWFATHRDQLLGTAAVVQTRDGVFEWILPGEEVGSRKEELGSRKEELGSRKEELGSRNEELGMKENSAIPHSSFNIPRSPSRSHHVKLVVDRSKLAELPERIEPNFVEAKTLFDTLTEGTDKLDADLVWTLIAAKVGPIQIDFGEAEWQQMIERIRKLESWEGAVEV